jgi:cytoskeletal protein CcmA (bactofilin family)
VGNGDSISTYLGKDTEFEGNLKFYGTIRIDGHFKGQILGEGTLIVGQRAIIESDIHVSYILTSGEIRGNLIADKKIEIQASGKVIGDIQTPSLVISEGAIIEGNCLMNQTEKGVSRKLTVISSDRSEISLTS